MTDNIHRFVRLRRRVLQAYDLLLYLMLLALAAATFLPADASDASEPPDHCGNIQSSTEVMTR